MSAKYTISRGFDIYYDVLNPSGVEIAFACSWRVARKIADLYNADVVWRRYRDEIWSGLESAIEQAGAIAGAVSLQEEA